MGGKGCCPDRKFIKIIDRLCPCCAEGMRDVLAQLDDVEVSIATIDANGPGGGDNNFVIGGIPGIDPIQNNLIVTGTVPGAGQDRRNAAFPICNVVGIQTNNAEVSAILREIELPQLEPDEVCDCCEDAARSFLNRLVGQTVDIDTVNTREGFNNLQNVTIDAVGKGTVRLTKGNQTWILNICYISTIQQFTL
ncbi:hypothetical protein LC040_01585 [Bacillus tianshenii]|nr:hypothetical protein LC040_01585 [Bacillus tianshenii]